MKTAHRIPIIADIHTHSIASGHGSLDTITEMARAAAKASLTILGISDHAPATPGSAKSSYFRNLRLADRKLFGVNLIYGVELNILNENGDVDLDDELIRSLDYAFISMHHPVFRGGDAYSNTMAYINAMKHPGVRFLGHPDDGRFPVDYERLLDACLKYQVYPEINNASLVPDAYRTDGYRNCLEILSLCKKRNLPVLLSSDSHGRKYIGDMSYIFPLLEECAFPPQLVINSDMRLFYRVLG
ncbi:MAG: phosphatase [Bacillus sp. (in: Bacteria)]|nr:phosphatase [Bacillus sp. (in: firmicutes)]MCM1427505.1 phosphatase [Eubacterium sp.]